jgi:hypothetical protein
MRKLLALTGAAAILTLGAGTATADTSGDLDCSDFSTPIKISQGYDPFHLDGDHDGIACEGNPGEAVLTDLYADLRGESPTPTPDPAATTPELAHTGWSHTDWGPDRHPVRWIVAGGALVVVGGVGVAVGRRRKGGHR